MPTRPCTRTTSLRRSLCLLLPIALLLGAVSAQDTASADGSRHPYFNDRGTLRWHHTLADAKRAAQRENKLIFVEYGRRKCSNCRKLAERILPHDSIRSRLAATAVGLAAECDTPERSIYNLFRRHLPRARTLPFVAFLTPDGDWVVGWSGGRRLSQVSDTLAQAESTHMRLLRQPARSPRPVRRPAPTSRSPAAPTARPAPAAPTPGRPAPEHTDLERDDGCEGDECEGGSCKPPSFPCLPNPFELLTRKCPPKKPACPPAPAVAETCPDFPPPAKRIPVPERRVAATDAGRSAPAPRAPDLGTPPAGSPDGPAPTFPTPATQPQLPAPVVTKAPAARRAPVAPTGSPDGEPTATPQTGSAQTIAAAAAARSDWATVLVRTRGATRDQPVLWALNRKAHSWAHGRLAFAVRAVRENRFAEADAAVTEVRLAMHGESEAVDAERGIEAIELMRDMAPLAEKSLVRRTVRKTAYEKLRGSRWAPLFSPVKPPTAAVAERR